MNLIGVRTLKTAIGATFAMIIAEFIGLQYAVSAGIITILSIQSTKRQSFEIAIKRFVSTLIALAISVIIFSILGFNSLAFGIYILIFIPLTVKAKVTEGIVVSSVLVTHILLEKSIGLSLIYNEILLMIIGVGIALILNLYMPSLENKFKSDKEEIENLMREILINLSNSLRSQSVSINEEKLFFDLENKLEDARKRAYKTLNNYLFVDVVFYVHYVEMRIAQFQTIKHMRGHLERLYITYEQTEEIASFTANIAKAVGEKIPLQMLFDNLEDLREIFRKQDLPKTREEFENRAMLYQYLNDLEQFLEIKRDFD